MAQAKINNPLPRQNQQTPPVIPGQPPRYLPSAGSPRVSVQEQRRAEGLPDAIRAGDHAPRYGEMPTRPPFTATTPVPVNPNPAPKAGGSKTKQ
jgi:hypothetical protein